MASSTLALDAFWRGERDTVWIHGISGSTSNWYSQEEEGQPRRVPDGTAIFPVSAEEFVIRITQRIKIRTMIVRNNAPRYDFKINPGASLRLIGSGIDNRSPIPPRFLIRESARLAFSNASQLASPRRSAIIHVSAAGYLDFHDTSRGGNASVTNEGFVNFSDGATADEMTIENGDPFGTNNFPQLNFFDNSTAGAAHLVNLGSGIVDFSLTNGPSGDGKITAASLDNRWNVYLGDNTLTLQRNFVQNAEGTLFASLINGQVGNIVANGAAELAGNLTVNAYGGGGVAPGSYRILRAQGGRTGGFVLQSGISRSRLAYSSTEVYLIVDPP